MMTASLPPFPSFAAPEMPSPRRFSEWPPFPRPPSEQTAAMLRPSLPGLPPLPGDTVANATQSPLPSMPANASIFAKSADAAVAELITETSLTEEQEPLDFTDDDWAAALAPVVEQSLQHTWQQAGGSMETLWEPWLRTTIRRALAEQQALVEPVHAPGFFEHLTWRLKSLFGNHNYEAMAFEKSKRCRVEEVFLLEKNQLALLSYASKDAERNADSAHVMRTVEQLTETVRDDEGTVRLQYSLPRGRKAEVCVGRQSLLIAVTLGNLQESMRADLEYTLRRIEMRYGPRFEDRDEDLMLSIQPQLQDCLLITTPLTGSRNA